MHVRMMMQPTMQIHAKPILSALQTKEATLLDTSLDMADSTTPERLLAMKQDTSRSRDGTDASGSLDESGGFLGGTTEEVDDLETTAMPVDKIPHMKD